MSEAQWHRFRRAILLAGCFFGAGAQVPNAASTGSAVEADSISFATARPRGTIRGKVMDATGPVPARITAVEQSTKGSYKTTTDSTGAYTLAELPAGNYCARFEAAGHRSDSAGDKYETSASIPVGTTGVAELDMTVPARLEMLEVCSGTCMIESLPPKMRPSHPGIRLEVYAPNNLVSPRRELQLTVALTNISKHAISIPAGKAPGAVFDYQISAFGGCNCPGELHRNAGASDPDELPDEGAGKRGQTRLRPGKTLFDKIDLSKLMDLSSPMIYTVVVQRVDPTTKSTDKKLVQSHPISIAVMATE